MWTWFTEGIRSPGFQRKQGPGGEKLVYRWLDSWAWLVLYPLAMAVLAALLLRADLPPTPLWTGAICAVFAVLGVLTLRRWFNCTTVALEGADLVIRVRPFALPRAARVRPEQVAKVQIDETRSGTQTGGSAGNQRHYSLRIVTEEGARIKLAGGFSTFAKAGRARDAVEQFIESVKH
jgi:hypothetical protein